MTTAPNAQVELSLDSFERDLVSGSIKKAMAGVKSRDLWQVEPQKLRVMPGFNTRIRTAELDAHIRDLARSMELEGYYMDKPLSVLVVVENDEEVIYVTDGHCRLEAVLLAIANGAPIQKIPVVTEDGRTTKLEDLTVKLYRSNTGRKLTPYETGLVCKRLSRFGWDDGEIAEKLGMTANYVDGLLRLVGAPKEIQQAVIEDRISASGAIQLIRQHGANAVAELENMQAKAKSEGKTRVTNRHAANSGFKKAIGKVGMDLFTAAQQVKADPAFAALSEETRTTLEALLAQLEAAKAADAAPAAQAEQVNGEQTSTEETEAA